MVAGSPGIADAARAGTWVALAVWLAVLLGMLRHAVEPIRDELLSRRVRAQPRSR